VQLDFDSVAKGIRVPGPSLKITYVIPTKDNTRIGVLIHETIDGKENRLPHTEGTIKEALTDMGFQVIRIDPGAPKNNVVQLPLAQLRNRFLEQCEYLIVGVAEAEYSSDDGR